MSFHFRDTNLSKLSNEDDELLLKLIKDLFPSTECPDVLYPKFEKAIRAVWKNKGYIFVAKLVIFYYLIKKLYYILYIVQE